MDVRGIFTGLVIFCTKLFTTYIRLREMSPQSHQPTQHVRYYLCGMLPLVAFVGILSAWYLDYPHVKNRRDNSTILQLINFNLKEKDSDIGYTLLRSGWQTTGKPVCFPQ